MSELGALLRRRRLTPDAARRLWRLYLAAVRDAAGRRASPAARALALAAFGRLYRARGGSARGVGRALAHGIPLAVRAQWRPVAFAALIYAAAALAAGLAAAHSPAWAAALLPASLHPGSGGAGITPGPALSTMLFFHNVTVSAIAYAGGVFVGMGALAALAQNGALIGALAGWAAAHGEAGQFWPLIAPHAVLELPATFCAGGAGLAMGAAWLVPGERGRWAALFDAFRRTVPLFGVCAALLVGAALVEGLFTPQPIPGAYKLGAAALLAVAFGLYLGLPRAAPAHAPRPAGAAVATDDGAAPAARPLVPARAARARARPSPASDLWEVRLPEGALLRLEPAGVPSRALALALDTLVLAALMGAAAVAAEASGLGLGASRGAALLAIGGALFFGLYGFAWEWLGGGATPGKRALGLGVRLLDGRPPGAGAALVRNVMRTVDFLPAFYLLGVVSAAATGGSRRLGDWAAGTLVLHLPATEGARGTGRRPPVPLPRVRDCGPLPAGRTVPRAAALRLWRRRSRAGSPSWEAAARRCLAAAGLAEAPPEAGVEHLVAALDREGRLRGLAWAPTPPRDRSADLQPRAPRQAAAAGLPAPLAASVLTFWERRPGLDGPARAALAAALAGRLTASLGAPGLDQPDPDALVEHVAWLLSTPG